MQEKTTDHKARQRALRAELDATAERIDRRLAAMQSNAGEAVERVTSVARSKPLAIAGGAAVGGLLLAMLWRRRRRRRALRRSDAAHRRLVEQYVGTLVDQVRYSVAGGKNVDTAVREALEDRVPLIVYGEKVEDGSRGAIREFLDLALKTALGFAIRNALDVASDRVDLEGRVEALLVPQEGTSGVSAAVAES